MKVKIILLILINHTFVLWGQVVEVKNGGNYFFNYISTTDLVALKNESTLKHSTINDVKEELSGSQFRLTVNRIQDNKVYFTFWKFNKDLNAKINGDSINNKRVEYSLPLDQFQKNVKPLYNIVDWRVGAFTTPFKLRFEDFNFESNANLGVNIGAKFRWHRTVENGFGLEPIFGFGLASIKVDDTNSNALSATNLSAFSLNTGVVIHIIQDINFALTYGWDNLMGSDQSKYHWRYNGNGWFGLGINVSFSSDSNNSGAKGNQP